MEPEFEHHAAATLPRQQRDGVVLRVLLGEGFGLRSPVKTLSRQLYAEAQLRAGASLSLPPELTDRAVYVVSGRVRCKTESIPERRMAVFEPGGQPELHAELDSRVMLLGGEPFAQRRYMFWNFVSSSQERIEQAKRDWEDGRFAVVPGDEHERVPLPER